MNKNTAENQNEHCEGKSMLLTFATWLCPKTINRLRFLRSQKALAYTNYCNYKIISSTNQGNGGHLAKNNFEECAQFYNANKYWWMKSMPSSVEFVSKG